MAAATADVLDAGVVDCAAAMTAAAALTSEADTVNRAVC